MRRVLERWSACLVTSRVKMVVVNIASEKELELTRTFAAKNESADFPLVCIRVTFCEQDVRMP